MGCIWTFVLGHFQPQQSFICYIQAQRTTSCCQMCCSRTTLKDFIISEGNLDPNKPCLCRSTWFYWWKMFTMKQKLFNLPRSCHPVMHSLHHGIVVCIWKADLSYTDDNWGTRWTVALVKEEWGVLQGGEQAHWSRLCFQVTSHIMFIQFNPNWIGVIYKARKDKESLEVVPKKSVLKLVVGNIKRIR